MKESMFIFSSLNPKKENIFYTKSTLSKINRFNTIIKGSGYYTYEWDEGFQKHIKKWIETPNEQ